MIVIALGVQAEAEFAIPVSDLDVVMGRRERLGFGADPFAASEGSQGLISIPRRRDRLTSS
jgi:hypothetical protein